MARAVAVQPDGRIVVAGVATIGPGNKPGDFALARCNADATLDLSFGSGGLVTTDFAGGDDRIFGLALQSDGKIIAAGRAFTSTTDNFDFALARYDANGNLDSSFGSGGKVTTDFTGGFDWAFAVIVQPDGNIVLGGLATNSATAEDFALARYLGDKVSR